MHALEMNPMTGEYAFAAGRDTAWHRLGDFTADRLLTIDEAVEKSRLANWNVHTVPAGGLIDPNDPLSWTPVPGKAVTVRHNPWTGEKQIVDVVGENYQPIQNEWLAEFMGRLISQAGNDQCVSAAGSIMEGRRAFITMAFPEEITVAGEDAHNLWLSGITSHDGSMAMTTIAGLTRVVCKNTADWALQGADPKHKVRHSGNTQGKVQEAREVLGIAHRYAEAYTREMEALLAERLTDKAFEKMMDKAFGLEVDEDDTVRVANRKNRDRDVLSYLWKNSPTTEVGRGTKYAAVNAVTEWAEWGRPGDLSTEKAAVSNLFGNTAILRAKGFKVLAKA